MGWWFIVFLFVLQGCSPLNLEDFKKSGESVAAQVTEELSHCYTKEDLQRHVPSLKKKFNRLVDIVIEAKEFQIKHPDSLPGADYASEVSSDLQSELIRLYQIEGARLLIENAQQEALERLDRYYQKLHKDK